MGWGRMMTQKCLVTCGFSVHGFAMTIGLFLL